MVGAMANATLDPYSPSSGQDSVIGKNVFLVKEHVGFFKAASNFDIYDPETGEIVLECREENLGTLTKLARFSKYKKMTPFDIQIRTPQGEPA